MNGSGLRIVKAAALVASAVSVLSMVVLFAPIPVLTGRGSLFGSIGILPLLVSTPIAATILTVTQRGWARVLSLCALVPAWAAAVFVVTLWLKLWAPHEVLALIGFLAVELALPVSALLVGASALTLAFNDVGRWLRSRRAAGPVCREAELEGGREHQ